MIYRHPNGNLDNFTDYFYEAIDKISNESKLCTLLGEFNLNLFNRSIAFQYKIDCLLKTQRITRIVYVGEMGYGNEVLQYKRTIT